MCNNKITQNESWERGRRGRLRVKNDDNKGAKCSLENFIIAI